MRRSSGSTSGEAGGPTKYQLRKEPEFRGSQPSRSSREEQPPRIVHRRSNFRGGQQVQREQMALDIVQTHRESSSRGSMQTQRDSSLEGASDSGDSSSRGSMQTQSELDLRESVGSAGESIIQREFPLRFRWERDIFHN
jgi:hypothetical protein